MTKLKQKLTFIGACDLLVEAKTCEGRWSIGTNANLTEIVLPAGGISARKDGYFRRSDVCRLIGYVQQWKRDIAKAT